MKRASVDKDTGHASLVATGEATLIRRHEADVPTAAERREEEPNHQARNHSKRMAPGQ